MHVFSLKTRELWGEWEIRVVVLVSLACQAFLIVAGNRRKTSGKKEFKFLVWCSYLTADWVAIVALGVLSGTKLDFIEPEHTIHAFWAPFLLLHLGGPDTITAYSLEDNELWWRHLVSLIFQVGVAWYIVVKAWTGENELNYLAVPVFVAGFLKISERIWVQRRASSKYFRKSMLSAPEPGPNYARHMAEYHCRRLEGFEVLSTKMFEVPTASEHAVSVVPAATDNLRGEDYLSNAKSFFDVFKQLFADLILSLNDMQNSKFFFQSSPFEAAFKVIEIELGFVYDVFYTKSAVIFSVPGGFVRVVSFSSTLVTFLFFIGVDKTPYRDIDVGITYLLLAGAIGLEIYALGLVLCSDRAMLWLSSRGSRRAVFLYEVVSKVYSPERERWSNRIAQFNLINLCSESRPTKWKYLQKGICLYETMEKSRYKDMPRIHITLKELIYTRLKIRSMRELNGSGEAWSQRVEALLEEMKLEWIVGEAEFDQIVLLWHIATDLCYHSGDGHASVAKTNSKLVSEYMMYLMAVKPAMLPEGIGQIRLQDTRAEGDEFFKGRDRRKDARAALMDVSTDVPPVEVKGDKSKSVLFDACVLAKKLRDVGWEQGRMWEVVSHVWVEMICHAASQCHRSRHLQQLRQGGELLTHVWLLMAHLGITKQHQVSKGHIRAKLVLN